MKAIGDLTACAALVAIPEVVVLTQVTLWQLTIVLWAAWLSLPPVLI